MTPATTVIGICGGSGSGKTTLAEAVARRLAAEGVTRLDFDAYYRPLPVGTAAGEYNFDHPDALDVELFRAHLEALRAGRAIEAPVYDFATHARAAETRPLRPAPWVVVDGILLFHDPAIVALIDYRIFVETPEPTRRARRELRDVESRGRSLECVRAQFERTVGPMHAAFVEPCKERADLIVDGDAPFTDPFLGGWIEAARVGAPR